MICYLKLMLADYRQQKHGKFKLQSASPIHYSTLKTEWPNNRKQPGTLYLCKFSPKPTNN